MHELSITENLLDLALKHARDAGANRITDLHLVIGQLSSFVDDSIQFYWDTISQGTIAEGACLHFRRVRAECLCHSCGQRAELTPDFTCPYCGSPALQVLTGDEFYLESIEVDLPPTSESENP